MKRRLWSSFLFVLAVINLCSKLASRGAQTSLLTSGLIFHLHFENGSKVDDKCYGFWQCGIKFCELEKLNTTYISTIINPLPDNTNCKAEGFNWIIKWIHIKCCLIFLSVSTLIFIVGIISIRIRRTLAGVCLILAITLLSVSYIFEFVWMIHYTEVYYDSEPQIVEIWNIVMSFLLIMGIIISYFPLLTRNKYDERL